MKNNRDTNSITYLFSEMDPSEEVEFERSLNENENLLIEVESFRKVTERLNDLPKVEPPKEVCESIYAMAANRPASRSTWHRPIFYAAAAVLFAGFTATALITDPEESSAGADQAAQASSSYGTVMQAPSADTGSQLTNQTSTVKPMPWVDNNEVIRFSDRIGQTESASFDSIFRNSYQRLTPLTDSDSFRGMQRQLQLTGSRPR
ncbi:hypothetical protein [Rhodohalobacter mucosus]|uniref:Uncharacterized protein n=1 Tax=Rhodohalobacter mucosus TaxID=2079485 RepID=A0A316TVG4_9BACT|nr:hypothetical protein [Rhodohalobacter mucosus]PWN06444.1 hypothetical protein DDZ15_07930 [Rhodohalobacter mucosus]